MYTRQSWMTALVSAALVMALALPAAAQTNDFTMAVSPSSVSVAAGKAASVTITTTTSAGSAQTVSFQVSGLPTGATGTFNPSTVTSGATSTFTLATTSSTPNGTFTVTITGAGTSATHTATFAATVRGSSPGIVDGGFESADFSGWTAKGQVESIDQLDPHTGLYENRDGATYATPGDSSMTQTFTVPAGYAALSFWYRMTCGDTSTYDWATVTLLDNSTGVQATPLGPTCTTNASYVRVLTSVSTGHTYTLTLTNHDDGSAGDPSYTDFDDVSLVAGDFSVAVDPTSATTTAGRAVTATVNTARTSGPPQMLALSASGLPSGAMASFSPTAAKAGTPWSMTITTSTSTPVGVYTVQISATGSTVRTVPFKLTVTRSAWQLSSGG